jgi:hypothetical protein
LSALRTGRSLLPTNIFFFFWPSFLLEANIWNYNIKMYIEEGCNASGMAQSSQGRAGRQGFYYQQKEIYVYLCVQQSVQTSSDVHPVCYPMGTRCPLPEDKAAGARSLTVTSMYCPSQEWWSNTSAVLQVFMECCLIN